MSVDTPVCIVSGGSRGLGRALVERALARGERVATFARSQGAFLDGLLSDPSMRERIHVECLDAADTDAVAAFAMHVMDRFGRIDALINNAGVGAEGLLTTMSRTTIANTLAVNLSGVISLTQAAVKCMLVGGSGNVVNISSVNGLRGHKGLAVYSATKSALIGFTLSLARELGPQRIRVNTVAPGFFLSDMVTHLPENQLQRIVRRTPLRRLCTVDDIVNSVDFLRDCESITGQTLAVDGGFSC